MWTADLGDGTYRNPILYTDYSDPDAIRVENDYYMVASSFSNAPGLPLLHSTDLVNWKLINYCVDRIPEIRYRNPIHGCGVWAPSIRFHKGTYYVCFPMPDEGIYMTTATDPYGEWSKPVNIRPGAGWIDPCPFWDDDGKAYLVAGVAKSRIGYKSVLHMVEMQPDGMGLIGEEVKIFDGNENDQVTIEGPKMYKRNGWYYIFAPAGGVKTGWQTVLRSRNPFGPYEYKIVMRQGSSAVNGPHQGAWVNTVTGQDWFIHFQDVYAAGRITHLQPMHWENDWPVIGVNREGSDWGEPVETYTKPDVDILGLSKCNMLSDRNMASNRNMVSDLFKGDMLSYGFQWNANYEDDWCETAGWKDGIAGEHESNRESDSTINRSYNFAGTNQSVDIKKNNAGSRLSGLKLRLRSVPAHSTRPFGDTRNILLRKWDSDNLSCVTKFNLSEMNDGDVAGYISLGIRYIAVTFEKRADRIEVYHTTGKQNFDCDVAYTVEEREYIGVIDTDNWNLEFDSDSACSSECEALGERHTESTGNTISTCSDKHVTSVERHNEAAWNTTSVCSSDCKTTGEVCIKYDVVRTGSRDCIEGGIPVKDVPIFTTALSVSVDNRGYYALPAIEAEAGRWVGVKHGFFIRHDSSVKTEPGALTIEL